MAWTRIARPGRNRVGEDSMEMYVVMESTTVHASRVFASLQLTMAAGVLSSLAQPTASEKE